MLVESDVVDGTETQGESEGRRNRAEVSKHSHVADWRQRNSKSLKYLAQNHILTLSYTHVQAFQVCRDL